jgi:uncharacterized protein
MIRATLLFLCLSLWPMAARAADPGSVWLVESATTRLYLCGTIHLLRKDDYPLPTSYDRAYEDSQRLVFELPPGSARDPALGMKMMEAGTLKDGRELNDLLTPVTVKALQNWARDHGMPRSSFKTLRPWLTALTISMTEYLATGADSSKGVDITFEEKARIDGKPGEGLESVDKQVSLFADLTDQEQVELLEQTLAEVETLPETFEIMIKAWREGDVDSLFSMLNKEAAKYPHLMAKFLTDRNEAWIKPLKRLLGGTEHVMVLVGTGHLGGPKGVIELLRKQGFRVRQVKE